MKDLGSSLFGLLVIVVFAWVGNIAWNALFGRDYSKPWWTGTEIQEVCHWQGSPCYELAVNSDGDRVTRVNFPNGGYIAPAYTACFQQAGSKTGFCEFTENSGEQWDIVED